MAVPKKKTSKSKRDMRRAHDALAAPGISTCPQCKEPKQPHRVCASPAAPTRARTSLNPNNLKRASV
jgi:large subunit ribosomal protein L32